MKVCGFEVEFDILNVKDEIFISKRMTSEGFTINSLGSMRVKNIYNLAIGIESVDGEKFNEDFDGAVKWLVELDSITLDYFIEAWGRFMLVEMNRFETVYRTQETPSWPIPIIPSTVGKMTVEEAFPDEEGTSKEEIERDDTTGETTE